MALNLNMQQYDPLTAAVAARPQTLQMPSQFTGPPVSGPTSFSPNSQAMAKPMPAAAQQPTASQREILAKTIAAEAGNQGFDGKIAVGSVIKNRAASGRWGSSLEDVIMAPGQFSAWNSATGYAGGEQGQDMANIRPSEEDYAAADAVLAGSYEDPTGGALNYYNPEVSQPGWGGGESWQRIGDHVFGTAEGGGGGGGGRQTMSTQGSTQDAQPATRQSVIQQLSSGDISGAIGTMFNGQARGPLMDAEVAGQKKERLAELSDRVLSQMNDTNAPVSWMQVLGGGAAAFGERRNRNKEADSKQAITEQLAELTSTGRTDPKTLAMISALAPELGAQMQSEQRQFERQGTLADQNFARQSTLQEDSQAHALELEGLRQESKVPADGRTTLQKEADDLFPDNPTARRDWIMTQRDTNESAEVKAAQLAAGSGDFNKENAKAAAARLDTVVLGASRSAQQLANLDRMDQALTRAVTGIAGPGAAKVGEALSWFGITPDDMTPGVAKIMQDFGLTQEQAASGEVLEAIANEMTVGMIGTDGFPANNFSDADRQFLQRIFPQMSDTQNGAFEKLGNLRVRYQLQSMKLDEWMAIKNSLAQKEGRKANDDDYLQFERDFAEKQREIAPRLMQEYAYELTESADEARGIAHASTQQEFDALPPGTKYRDPDTNTLMVKPGAPATTAPGRP